MRLSNFFRTIFFMPIILDVTIIGLVWSLFLHPLGGPAQTLLGLFGARSEFLGGLQTVPNELREAARIDGANAWQVFKNITFPLLTPSLNTNILLEIIGSLQAWQLFLVIKGPTNGLNVLGIWVYALAFGRQSNNPTSVAMRQGYGAAASMVLFLIVLVIGMVALARRVEAALLKGLPGEGVKVDGAARKALMDALGEAGGAYRAGLYENGLSGERERLGLNETIALCDIAIAHLDRAIRANRRPDGLYHAYNVMRLEGADASSVEIELLAVMLEGHVAVLNSGALSLREAADLLDALRASDFYRPDQGSYLLYPDHWPKSFLEANTIPEAQARASRTIGELAKRADSGIVVRDAAGGLHFGAGMRNEGALVEALGRQGVDGREILDIYEEVFHHRSFTGRSGSFCKYEGLGCIYWHMVSKLLVCVGELSARAGADVGRGADAGNAEALARLESAYREIREGLGAHKDPAVCGAFPTDPYSHTPSFIGARVEAGRLRFAPSFAAKDEILREEREFRYVDACGSDRSARIEAGCYAFTICQVLVVVHCFASGDARV
jgi:hypothetical protein